MNKNEFGNLGFGGFWKESFRSAAECFWPLLGMVVLFSVCMTVVLMLAVFIGGAMAALLPGRLRMAASAAVPAFIYVYGILLLYISALRLVYFKINREEYGIFDSIGGNAGRIFSFAAVALLMSVPVSLVSLGIYAAGKQSIGLYAVLYLINLLALVYVIFCLPAIAVREKGVISCFSYSFSLVKGNYFKILGYLFSVGIFLAAVQGAVWLVYGITGYLAHSLSPGLMIALLIFSVVSGLAVANYVFSFSFSSYLTLFLILDAQKYGDAVPGAYVPAPEPAAPSSAPHRAEKTEEKENMTESQKFYKSLFDKANEAADSSPDGEMPTIFVDLANNTDANIEKVLAKRIKESKRARAERDALENTISPSHQQLDIYVEETEFLPEQSVDNIPGREANKPLPPPEPATPRLKVMTAPPLPPNKEINKNGPEN